MTRISFRKIVAGAACFRSCDAGFVKYANTQGLNRAFAAIHSRYASNIPEGGRLFREDLNVIYDSKCNVCKLEIDFLKRRDEKYNGIDNRRLKFTDIEDEAYSEKDPANGGISYEEGMKAMRAVTSKGEVMTGVPVFHEAYRAVGLGWLFSITKYAGVKQIADAAYNVFAKYRTNLTRGKSVDELVSLYKEKKALQQQQDKAMCEDDRCQKV